MSQSEKSRFDELFSTARPAQEAPSKGGSQESKPEPLRQSKSNNPDYVRTTVYLPKALHKQLKARAVVEEREMSGIVEELIQDWLEAK